ncbi:MAG: hypothetical protein JWN04_4416 [Myxococcaceae bacterium]|nr:hypothetical protein [Myxococcaceae bacterium]
MNPLPPAAAPGPQPALPPLTAPVTPLVPEPEAPGYAASQPGAAPAPFPQGSPPPAYNSYSQESAVYVPPDSPDQPQPYSGQFATPTGYPQPRYYQRPLSRPPGPGSHEHEGFFLRITAGGGAAGMTYHERFDGVHTSHVKTRGLAGSADVAVGARVVGSLIVHGNLSVTAINARRSIDGVQDDSYNSIRSKFWLVGVGATYYVMPTNLYLTLVLGTGGMLEQRDYGSAGKGPESIHTRPGFGSSLAIGKEWWVGGRGDWGIGASITGSLYAAGIDVAGVKSTAVGNAISLAFSATLN